VKPAAAHSAWLALLLAGGAMAAPEGSALFAQHCAVCHQADASGVAGLAPPLKGEHWAKLGSDRSYLPTVVLKGLLGPIQLGSGQGGQSFNGNMPGFAPTLDDETIAAIASHVLTLQGGDKATAYSADEIKAARQRTGSPTQSRQMRSQLLGSK
jgi:mono/diheme cytochrome c family protein